jgi:hypothetical protein
LIQSFNILENHYFILVYIWNHNEFDENHTDTLILFKF